MAKRAAPHEFKRGEIVRTLEPLPGVPAGERGRCPSRSPDQAANVRQRRRRRLIDGSKLARPTTRPPARRAEAAAEDGRARRRGGGPSTAAPATRPSAGSWCRPARTLSGRERNRRLRSTALTAEGKGSHEAQHAAQLRRRLRSAERVAAPEGRPRHGLGRGLRLRRRRPHRLLAAKTERRDQLGDLPITPAPSLLAMTAAGLDTLSDARFILGLGARLSDRGLPASPTTSRSPTREIVEICRSV